MVVSANLFQSEYKFDIQSFSLTKTSIFYRYFAASIWEKGL